MLNRLKRGLARFFKGNGQITSIEALPHDREVQVAMANVILADIIKERRRDRFWILLKRIGFSLTFLLGLIYYMAFQFSIGGWRIVPRDPLVGVIRIKGSIMNTSIASAEKVIPTLKRAFEASNVKAIVLDIDSPGGAPVEAERINYVIDQMKSKYNKPVYAVIQNVGASAAYMIALHANKIYAGRYSMVGSVGAVISAWDVHQALAKYGVYQKVYASGDLKAMLNPFIPTTPAAEEKAQSLVNLMGHRFANELIERRSKLLQSDMKYDTGELWDGEVAKKLGLIDELGTIESVSSLYPDAKIYEFGPSNSSLGLFSASVGQWVQSIIATAIRNAVTE